MTMPIDRQNMRDQNNGTEPGMEFPRSSGLPRLNERDRMDQRKGVEGGAMAFPRPSGSTIRGNMRDRMRQHSVGDDGGMEFPRPSGDATTTPAPGTPRGDLLALLTPDFVSLPPDSMLSDASVTTFLAADPVATRAKMHLVFCTPPGPLYCEAEKMAWVALHPWCNAALVELTPPPLLTDAVTRTAWMALHPTCILPPLLSDHTCTPGDPSCATPATSATTSGGMGAFGWFVAGAAVLAIGKWLVDGSARGNPRDTTGLFYLKREPLNNGGYTSRGQYFGIGAPLYRWSVDFTNGDYDGGHVRGSTREAAMAKIREKHPMAKFVNK